MSYTVRQARRMAEKSQLEAARSIGVSLGTYCKLEKNPEKFTIAQAKTLSRLFGFSYDAIFFDSDSN